MTPKPVVPPKAGTTRWRRLDLGSLVVLPAGIAVILAAQVLEGGTTRSLVQGPAALIVFGGTLSALLISHSPRQVGRAVRDAAATFASPPEEAGELRARFIDYATRGHRRGLLSLEDELDRIEDPFLRHGLSLVIDGASHAQLEEALSFARSASDADEDVPVRIFEAAAGYAPTLGILGAVLGLIQVMEHLGQPGALGSGIAVAFVATVYGVGVANLVFLPIAGRLRERSAAADRRRELLSEGLFALQQRITPRLVAQRLLPFVRDSPSRARVAARPVRPGGGGSASGRPEAI